MSADLLDDEIDRLAAEFLTAAERGEAPDPAGWLARHPAHAAELAVFLADLGLFAPLLGLPALPADPDLTADLNSPYTPGATGGPGERFDVFELTELLGSGGMGEVHRAARVGTRLVVALKRVRAGVPAAEAQRFREEAEALLGLDHEHIVKVYHVGESDGRPYFTMRLAEGGSLDRHAGRFAADPRAAARLMVQVARAVHHAHQRQVVHRDLKPANVLLDEAGRPLVADFGLAARLEGPQSGTGAAGSLPWMAPEAVRGEPVTTAVDVWGLGAILYELLTGKRAFPQQTRAELRQAILEQEPPAPSSTNLAIDPDLEAVCLRCLAKSPGARYESASAVARDLERWLRDEPVRARIPTRRERAARWYRHNPALAWGALVLVLLLAGAAAVGVALAAAQRRALEQQVLAACEADAWGTAKSVQLKLRVLDAPLTAAAGDEALRAACARPPDPTRGPAVAGALTAAWAKQQAAHPEAGFETVFVLDPGGTIVALIGRPGAGGKSVVGTRKADRDYFSGAQGRWRAGGLHASRVFHSDHDENDKIALSVPLHPGGVPAPGPWVLAATVATDSTFGVDGLQRPGRVRAVLARRDVSSAGPDEPDRDGYRLLVHPGFAEKAPSVPPGPGLDLNETRHPDYRDPVRGYEGRWLAGSWRVADTGLVVVVQQRHKVAMTPQEQFFNRLGWLVGGAVAAALVALAALAGARLLRGRSAGDGGPSA